jgi:MoxR-like ATPase
MHPVAQKMGALSAQLKTYFQEMDDPIEAIQLAILSGQHVFLLGPPGVAKTQLIRATIKAIVHGARYFECTLSRNRPAEVVIGPLDTKRWRDTGEYIYNREGYATQVEFALFNEIGKMSDELGHDLLTLLNERLIHEVRTDPATGDKRSVWDAPLSTAFCDSNEMLTEGSDDAAALWDRLPLRVVVEPVASDSAFAAILKSGDPHVDVQIEWEELQDVILKVVPSIEIPDDVLHAMVKLRRDLAEEGVKPSPRHFKQAMDVLRASAFLADRDVVTTDDIASLRLVLWDTVAQIQIVDRLCRSTSNPYVARLITLRNNIHELQETLEKKHKKFVDAGSDFNGAEGSDLQLHGKECDKKLKAVRTELDTMLIEAGGRPIPGFKAIHDLQQSVLIQVMTTALGQGHAEAVKMAQKPERFGSGDGANA